MKAFYAIDFDPIQCRRELDNFGELLKSKAEFSERDDLQPMFKSSRQRTAFIGAVIPNIGPADRLAYEFQVFGDFAADIVLGNFDRKTFCAIELEDARPNSVFRDGGRAEREWGTRFEHGFGQLIDWFYSFDDHKNSAGFAKNFGYGHIAFYGLLLIGRSAAISEHERSRLRWRSDRVSVNTHKIFCLTYDELYDALNREWRLSSLASGHP